MSWLPASGPRLCSTWSVFAVAKPWTSWKCTGRQPRDVVGNLPQTCIEVELYFCPSTIKQSLKLTSMHAACTACTLSKGLNPPQDASEH